MNIREGMKARFEPTAFSFGSGSHTDQITVVGTVKYVNWDHRVFTVEYEAGGTIQTEAFHFFDIGKTVTLYG